MSTKCLFCGVSTRVGPRRSNKRPIKSFELNDTCLQKYPCIQDYVHFKFPFRKEIAATERTCRPCLLRAQRLYNKKLKSQINETLPIQEVTVTESSFQEEWFQEFADDVTNDDVTNGMKNEDVTNYMKNDDVTNDVTNDMKNDIKTDEDIKNITPIQSVKKVIKIPAYLLPGFKRLSHTSTFCVIAGCGAKHLHRIQLAIRRDILSKHSLYIPYGSRVCEEHVFGDIWRNFPTFCRPTHDTFNAAQITDMLKLLQIYNHFMDVSRLKSVIDTVFQYYTGFTKEEFVALLEQTPLLKQDRRALAAFLCKLHTRDSNQRLAYVLRMTPTQFERDMEKARVALDKQYVPRLFGF